MEADTIQHGRSFTSQKGGVNFLGFGRIATFLLVTLLLTTAFAHAQITIAGKEGHLGIRAGLNLTKFSGDLDEDVMFKPGLQLGVVANFPMKNEKIIFQPGIIFSQMGAKWEDSDSGTIGQIKWSTEEVMTFTLNYLKLPANFLWQNPLGSGNVLLLQAGPYLGYGIGGKAKLQETVKMGDETETEKEEETINFGGSSSKHDFKSFDLGIGLGVGILFQDKFQVGIGYNLGLSDIGHHFVVKNNGFAVTLTYMLGK